MTLKRNVARLEARQATSTAGSSLDDIRRRFYSDPLAFVMYAFQWSVDPALRLVNLREPWSFVYATQHGPEQWACQFLDDLGELVRSRAFDGEHAVPPIRMAAVSGHGVAKSTLSAWLTIWLMATRPFARGTVTAGTSQQLETRTWPEVAKWLRRARPEIRDAFDITTGRGAMRLRHREYPESWFVSAQTSDRENSESFAGQHSASSTSFYIFDEASAVPSVIDEVSEGGLSDGEPMKFLFGNGTRPSGFFHDAFHKLQRRYDKLYRIDSRDTQLVNKAKIEEDIRDFGLASDFVKVRWLGEFSSTGEANFFDADQITQAMQRPSVPGSRAEPMIIGVDVARFGADSSVIFFRQGLDARTLPPIKLQGHDTMAVAARVAGEARLLRKVGYQVSIMVDGVGLGAGVCDRLRSLGFDVIDVQAAGRASDPQAFANVRGEMHGAVRDWLRQGGVLPQDEALAEELRTVEFGYTLDGRLRIEKKDSIRDRLGRSPDTLDALCLTFAAPVNFVDERFADLIEAEHERQRNARSNYNPLADGWQRRGHNPFANF